MFEAIIIFAALEDEIPDMSLSEPSGSPLLDWYSNWGRNISELNGEGGSEDPAKIAKSNHVKRVVELFQDPVRIGDGLMGFAQAVKRIELLSTTLINEQQDPSATNS